MGRHKIEHKSHTVEIDGNIGKLRAYTKKGKPVVAIFDAADIDKIRAFKNWRAVWNKDWDCQVIESKDFKDGHAKRTPVAAAILECSPNAPIRHINVNFLDNRRTNLEIHDVKAHPNEYECDKHAVITLKDRCGYTTGVCSVDKEDIDLVINSGHIWFRKRRSSGQPYVVNQNGLLLAHLLLEIEDGLIIYKNRNPFDNRRENIKIDIDIQKS